MKRVTFLFALFILAGIIHLAGCSQTPRDSQQEAPAKTDSIAPPEVAEEPSENTAASQAIKDYLSQFGIPGAKTSWYDNIKDISVQGDIVLVKTDLSAGDPKVGNVCGAVSGYVYSNENRTAGLQLKVHVYGADGQLLVNRANAADRCLP